MYMGKCSIFFITVRGNFRYYSSRINSPKRYNKGDVYGTCQGEKQIARLIYNSAVADRPLLNTEGVGLHKGRKQLINSC